MSNTATREQIVSHFLAVLRDVQWRGVNWGCDINLPEHKAQIVSDDAEIDWIDSPLGVWDVTEHTYINGVVLTVDLDYHFGYLLEVVERNDPSVVSYIAVAVFHGWYKESRYKIDHDSMWYEPYCGTFFDRTPEADHVKVGQWAISSIYGMVDAYEEARRNKRTPAH